MNETEIQLKLTANSSEVVKQVQAISGEFKKLAAESSKALNQRQRFALAFAGSRLTSSLLGTFGNVETKWGKNLASATSEASKFASVLIPFGKHFGLAGVAVGGLVGVIMSLSERSKEAREKMEKMAVAFRGLVDSDIRDEWKELNAKTPEDRAKIQTDAREQLELAKLTLARGGTVSDDLVRFASRWDLDTTKQLLERRKEQNGGAVPDALKYLDEALKLPERSEWVKQGKAEYWNARDSGDYRLAAKIEKNLEKPSYDLQSSQEAFDKLSKEAQLILSGGTRFDSELDKLLATEKQTPATPEKAVKNPLAPAHVDSLSSMGIGYTGAGIAQRIENILSSILKASQETARSTAATATNGTLATLGA